MVCYGMVGMNFARQKLSKDIGSQMITAPELRIKSLKKTDEKTDAYAYAILLYRMLVKQEIFAPEGHGQTFAENKESR